MGLCYHGHERKPRLDPLHFQHHPLIETDPVTSITPAMAQLENIEASQKRPPWKAVEISHQSTFRGLGMNATTIPQGRMTPAGVLE